MILAVMRLPWLLVLVLLVSHLATVFAIHSARTLGEGPPSADVVLASASGSTASAGGVTTQDIAEAAVDHHVSVYLPELNDPTVIAVAGPAAQRIFGNESVPEDAVVIPPESPLISLPDSRVSSAFGGAQVVPSATGTFPGLSGETTAVLSLNGFDGLTGALDGGMPWQGVVHGNASEVQAWGRDIEALGATVSLRKTVSWWAQAFALGPINSTMLPVAAVVVIGVSLGWVLGIRRVQRPIRVLRMIGATRMGALGAVVPSAALAWLLSLAALAFPATWYIFGSGAVSSAQGSVGIAVALVLVADFIFAIGTMMVALSPALKGGGSA